MSWGKNRKVLVLLIPIVASLPPQTWGRFRPNTGLGTNTINSQHLVGVTGCNMGMDEMLSCPGLRIVGETDT